MKKLLAIVAAVVVLISGWSFAQEKPAVELKKETNQNKEERYKDIKELLVATGSENMGKEIAGQIVAAYKQQYPDLTEAEWESYIKKMKTEELNEKMIPVYDKYFSNEEIRDIVKFYNSPTGKKTMKTMPMMMQEQMMISQEWGDGKAEEMTKSITQEIEAKSKQGKKEEKKEEIKK